MAGRPLLALDFGTSTLRALIGTCDGRVLASAEAPVRYRSLEDGAREFRPSQVVASFARLTRQALCDAGISAGDVAAVAVTGQRQAVVFLDKKGVELYCGPQFDPRAALQGMALDAEHGEEIYRTTGHLPSVMYPLARLRWFREMQPQVYERIAAVLPVASWLAWRLTGQQACEPCLASEAGLMDVSSRRPCDGLLAKLGLAPSLVPLLTGAGVPVGGLSSTLAERLGLKPGLPVAIAGPDTQCGLLAMGVKKTGHAGVIAGWSCTVQLVTPTPCFDSEMRTWVGILPTAHNWIAESNVGDAGNAYRWLVDSLMSGNGRYARAEALARAVSPGCDGALALLGPGTVSMARAGLRMGGLLFPTPLSFQDTTPGHLLRAALENVAYGVRANLEELQRVTGLAPAGLCLGGGMSRNGLFCGILASVSGRPIQRSLRPEVSTLGALLAASVAAGERPSLEEAMRTFALPTEVVKPEPSLAAEYQDHYQRWRAVYDVVQGVE